MDVHAEVKRVASGIEVRLSGRDADRLETTGLQGFLQSRLACSKRNSCRPGDSVATKVKCVTDLLEHKFLARTSATHRGDVIRLDRTAAGFATQDRVERLVRTFAACRNKNQCSRKQSPVEKFACLNTVAQHILQR